MKNNPEIFKDSNSEFKSFFQEFLSLKEKEYNGEITFDELVTLLSIEFKQFTSTNAPINIEFDPKKELDRVRSSSWGDRGGELAKYKEKLITQKIAISECRIYLERLIRHSPDIDRKFLDRTIQNFKEKYGFSQNQIKIFNDLLDKFQEKRKDLLFLREKYPNDRDLFRFVTGVSVPESEELEVVVDPVNFYFRVSSNSMYPVDTDGRITGGTDFWKSNSVAGIFKSYKRELEGKEYKIGAIFLPVDKEITNNERFPKTLRHEREHATNSVLDDYFREYHRYNIGMNGSLIFDLRTKEQISNYLDDEYRLILDETKDELISQIISKTGDERVFLTDYNYQFKTRLGMALFNWSSYNYFRYLNIGEKGFFNDLRDDFWKSKVYFLKEQYKKDLNKSAKAFWTLVHDGKFTVNQAISLLTGKNLEDWPKEAKRILEIQRESNI